MKSVTRSLTLATAFVLLLAGSARADWFLTDLPFREYLGKPVTGLAPAGPSDLWAFSAYAYRYKDRDHARWNSLAYRSVNDGRLWDLPWDAPPGDPPPNSAP